MPSIGKDLAKIRNARGLSLQEIHADTKIPLTTLQSIENGSIFDTPTQGKTYIRSFVRSYGRALKIDDDVLINGLDQQETGNYNHLVWNHYESARATPGSGKFTLDDDEDVSDQTPSAGVEDSDLDYDDDKDLTTPAGKSKKGTEVENRGDEKTDLSKVLENSNTDTADGAVPKVKPGNQKTEADVNWVNMGHKFIETKKKTPVGIISLIIFLILAATAAFFLIKNDFFTSPDDSSTPSTATTTTAPQQDGSILDLNQTSESQTGATADTSIDTELGDILYLSVYAAYQRLDPVRVWSDVKPRMDPYWIEQGVAMNFDFQDTIRVRGQYSNLLLFMNGHLIQNPMELHYNQSENYIELTRDFFSNDPVFRSNVSFQTPDEVAEPDSIILRPSF